jgi:hypothetical protein
LVILSPFDPAWPYFVDRPALRLRNGDRAPEAVQDLVFDAVADART